MKYKIYVYRDIAGTEVIVKRFETKKEFYEYIGRLYLSSLLKINDIRYEVIKNDSKRTARPYSTGH